MVHALFFHTIDLSSVLASPASLRVPGVDSDDETKTPSPSPHHGRSRPPSLIADSSSESDEGDARGEVRYRYSQCDILLARMFHYKQFFCIGHKYGEDTLKQVPLKKCHLVQI